ncbi:MAG TPA: bifunctional hydroxymethylpyrimidine kinase/phosphomethylpyrimidine kinase [Vicinamibacterales bacterium]|nr:bifunctional hydroxymethylpyrimidine kinase/phosphomethylpyrimidine kinase [Vicinamibacterales bacterium]
MAVPTLVALTIAGSDSGGGAGIQADLKTFAAHGVYGVSAITAVTAQNTRAVSAVEALSPGIVAAQIAAVVDDFQVAALKTGMLANAAIIGAVSRVLRVSRVGPLVVDPVMVAKSGDRLLDADALDALTRDLLPLAAVVTPNLPEAEVLAGIPVRTLDDQREAARRIVALGARAVVVKGGHAQSSEIVDVLFDGQAFTEFRGERVPGTSTHGTGCTFSAAIAAQLALGRGIQEAIPLAQAYVAKAIRNAPGLGGGHGPMGHL